ncbi:MAG: NUDIX hydrolase [Rhodobacteraceae bacterium]|jgi:8-oxo-dGTP diphosphatase|nr:NUDIX hydrolase [Paracoccaceae bacterium]MCZ8081562.1 NUDIX hydrolase [Paracoccaceae bacterium]
MITEAGFVGAKAALFCGDAILTCLRDTHPGLPWPGMWDLPGGGREGDESPEACLLRELHEEFGLRLPVARLTWRVVLPAMLHPNRKSVFFAGTVTVAEVAAIRFGDEGQGWALMPTDEFLTHPKAIPDLQHRVRLALSAQAVPQ